MSQNKSLSMKLLTNRTQKKINSVLPNSNNKKLIKLRFHGKIFPVPYDEFLSLRKMNREKMKALKDSLIQIIKTKKEIIKQQNSYDKESLKKISIEREDEFRKIIANLQNEIRKDKTIYKKDIYDSYEYIMSVVKNIYENANKEIEKRINNINNQVKINLLNCDYKHEKLLEKKIKENEEYFRYMNSSTFQMKKIMSNYEAINKKINEFQEKNFNYKKKLLKEEIKNEYLEYLLKKTKTKIYNTNKLLSEFNNNMNIKTISNEYNKSKYNSIFATKQKKNNPHSLKSFSTQKYLKTNNSTNKKNDLLLTIDEPNSHFRKRPFSSGQRLKTKEVYTNSTKRTNYSNSNTFQSNFRVNSSKGRPINSKANSYKNIFNVKNRIFKSNLSSNILKTNQNSYFMTSDIEENKENKKYTKSEWNSIILIKKEIKNLNNKKKEIIKRINENLPNNEIYMSIINIVEQLRKVKSHSIIDGINNKYMKGYMKAIPIQDKQFRKLFMEILFNDKKIYESIKNKTKENKNDLFNKNIFYAEKINKNYK